jgi:hypothetical protein
VNPAANGVAPETVGEPCQPRSMDKRTDELLMLTAVTATCTDCGGRRIFVPVDDTSGGEFCCTTCDAAIFLLVAVDGDRVRSRVA